MTVRTLPMAPQPLVAAGPAGPVELVVYTTTVPGIVLLPVEDPFETQVHTTRTGETTAAATITHDVLWRMHHHQGPALFDPLFSGGSGGYPHALRLAAALDGITDWTADQATVVARMQRDGRAAIRAIGVAAVELQGAVQTVQERVEAVAGPLPDTAVARIGAAVTEGWGLGPLSGRLLGFSSAVDVRGAILARIRRLPAPASPFGRPMWCQWPACDPATRLLRHDRTGQLSACPGCYPSPGRDD